MVDPHSYAELKRSFFDRWDEEMTEVTVVFAQGKTGTSTIAAGLKRAGFNPVFQIHTLQSRILANVEDEYARRPNDSYPRHVWEAQWLGAHLPSEAKPWRLVTSVRDPIARLVSRTFQQRSRYGDLGHGLTADALVRELNDQFQQQRKRLGGMGWDWFEAEMKEVLGLSVYDSPFHPEVGYGTISTGHVRALFLRSESLDRAPSALRAHFGRPVDLISENVGSDKDYATLYGQVLDRFRPPPEYVARVYETRQAQHFYSADELEAFRRHWTRPIEAPRS